MNITPKTFLDTIFDGKQADEHVLLTKKRGESWSSSAADDKGMRYLRSKTPVVYFCVSTVKETGETFQDGDRIWRRRRQDLIASYVIVLDDIGTKVEEHPPVEPSYKLESSEGNFQWGYLIEPTENIDRYEAIVAALGEKGWTDKGAGGSYRVMRVPGSLNDKPGKKNFISRITDWHPERSWDMDELALKMGVDVENMTVTRKKGVGTPRAGGAAAHDIDIDIDDPMLTWLADEGHIISDNGGEWVEIVCPWHEEHTDGRNMASYSPLGRGSGEWPERRAFNCLHEHCKDRAYKDFKGWAVNNGGPGVVGYDPLPWIQAQWVYLEVGRQFADMFQRPRGGTWVYSEQSWSNKYLEHIETRHRDQSVLIKTAMLDRREHNTRRATDLRYLPGQGELATDCGQDYVNSYVPPQHTPTEAAPEVFLKHMDFILPDEDERECFINWLAWKVQNPDKRSYAVVMVAEDSFGVGRTWIGKLLSKMWWGQVNHANLKQLIGKGTSAENTYNDWAVGCQLLIVNEAKDLSREDFWNSYDTFKERISNELVEWRVNPKFGHTRDEFLYFNALIFSNHADAMHIPEDDRRLAVLTNPREKRDDAYYQALWDAYHEGSEAARLWWFLKRRDLSGYDAVKPPVTEGKNLMIEASRSPAEQILAYIQGDAAGELVTYQILENQVRTAARILGLSAIQHTPANTARFIWKKLGSLRPGVNNGARYSIGGEQQEVRALLGKTRWKAADEVRDRDSIVIEVTKNDAPLGENGADNVIHLETT